MIVAAIDLGSNFIKLRIVQLSRDQISLLEEMSIDTILGEEVYTDQMITMSTIYRIVEGMEYYQSIMDGYSVDVCKAVATSGIRDARNAEQVVEIIKMRTGMDIEIIEDSVEKFYTYKALRDKVDNYQALRHSSIVVEINAGSSDISIYKNNRLVKNDEILLGSKALKFFIQKIEERTVNYARVVKEYTKSRMSLICRALALRTLTHFVAVGGEAKKLKQLFFNDSDVITTQQFRALAERAYQNDYDLRMKLGDEWYEFLATIIIYDNLLEAVDAKQIMIPDISLRDGIIAEISEQYWKQKRYRCFNNDIYSISYEIAKKYESDYKHIRYVEKISLKIFHALAEHMYFDKDDEMLLRQSAILHEIGKYTRIRSYQQANYHTILGLDIFGLSAHQIRLIANISRNITDYAVENIDDYLTNYEKAQIRKLAAILAIADSLDKGKSQCFNVLKVSLAGNHLGLDVERKGTSVIEEWEFENQQERFGKIFGIIPEMKEV